MTWWRIRTATFNWLLRFGPILSLGICSSAIWLVENPGSLFGWLFVGVGIGIAVTSYVVVFALTKPARLAIRSDTSGTVTGGTVTVLKDSGSWETARIAEDILKRDARRRKLQ